MKVEVRNDTVFISGYVNAVERYSRPIRETLHGEVKTFIERIKAGVFRNALKRNDNVLVLLNHKNDRELANTKDGTAKLEEDNIGLRAELTITDAEVVEKAKNGELVGWSFGFCANADELGKEGDQNTRTVTDLDLIEVSILDDTKTPAYYGTSIEAREGGARTVEYRADTIADIEKEAQEKHEQVANESEAQFDDAMNKHIDIEAEAETKKMELFASMVANKVIEALKTETKADETDDVEEPEEEIEDTDDVDDVEDGEDTAEDDEDVEDEEETRNIDYTDFENRLSAINKA